MVPENPHPPSIHSLFGLQREPCASKILIRNPTPKAISIKIDKKIQKIERLRGFRV